MLITGARALVSNNYSCKPSDKTNNNTPNVASTHQTRESIYSGQCAVNFRGRIVNFSNYGTSEQKLRQIIGDEEIANAIIERHFREENGSYTNKQAAKFIEIRNTVEKMLKIDNEALHAKLDPIVNSRSKSNVFAIDPDFAMREAVFDFLNTNSSVDTVMNIQDGKIQKEFASINFMAHDVHISFAAPHIAGLVLDSCKNPETGEYTYENLDEKIELIKKAHESSLEDLHEIIETSFDENGTFNIKTAKMLIGLPRLDIVVHPEERLALFEEFCLNSDSTLDEEKFSFFTKINEAFRSCAPEEMRVYMNAAINPITQKLDPACFDPLFKLADYLRNDYPYEDLPAPIDFIEIAKELTSTIETSRDSQTGTFDPCKWEKISDRLFKNNS